MCDYTYKREALLRKHIDTTHKGLVCKECQEELPTFMELTKHIAQNHEKYQIKVSGDRQAGDIQDKKHEDWKL